MQTEPKPPIASQKPEKLVKHNDERIDNYFWLRNPEDAEVIAYLERENDYTKAKMAHTEGLQKKIYDEMLSRIQETDLSVPYRKGDFYYYSRTEEGKDYPIYCRKQGSLDTQEEIILDQNKLAEGYEYFSIGILSISPNHNILAYSVDTSGAEQYTLFFLDLTTRKLYRESIPHTYYSSAWGNDNQTFFYTKIDDTNRPYQLWRHTLGSNAADVLVYQEDEESFFLSVGKTRSQTYLIMDLDSQITSEVHYLDADNPTGEFQIIAPREAGVEYGIEHHSDRFYITTNEEAINFKLMATPVTTPSKENWQTVTTPSKENWQTVIPHREDIMLSGISAFVDHLIIFERKAGLPTVRIQQFSTGEEHELSFPEPTYSVRESTNAEFDTTTWRFSYSSLVTPSSVFDYNLVTRERELKKEQEVLGGYDRTQYISKRLLATATDGTQVPISMVYKKGVEPDGTNPLFLTGYGSYGVSYPASFSSIRLSLLDRGIIYAIAHIRGGQEMGRKWYEDGKFLKKKNTFTDFITCGEYLIEENWTASDRLVISGGSAGGLLMGAVVNMRPDLFKAVVADVPFVDVVTTILDESLPLTVTEWDEWGNPNDKTYYDYMKSYSPYDNVEAKDYPDMLILGGLNDTRVKYWEPAKWTAKLREMKTDDKILLLKTNMGAGHGGASGRYESLKETAFEYAFLLDRLGLG